MRNASVKHVQTLANTLFPSVPSHANRQLKHVNRPTYLRKLAICWVLFAEPAVKACPSLNDFNYREHVTTTSWGNEPTVTLWVSFSLMELVTILVLLHNIPDTTSIGNLSFI